ncbi:folate family ECF transporter S component [Clostridium sp. DL1XJH146]
MFKIAKKRDKLYTKKVVLAGLLTAISIVLTRFLSLIIPIAGMSALRIGFGDIPIIVSGILLGPLFGGMTGFVADIVGYSVNPMGAYFPGFTFSATLMGAMPGIFINLLSRKKIKLNFKLVNVIVTLSLVISVIFIMFQNNVLSINEGVIYLYDGKLPIIVVMAIFIIILIFAFLPFIFWNKFKEEEAEYSVDKIMFVVSIVYMFISLVLNTFWLTFLFPGKGFLVFIPGRIIAAFVIIPTYSLLIYTICKVYKYV